MKKECYKFVLNILRVIQFVTSSLAVFEAATLVKSMYMTKSWLKTRKKYGNQIHFDTNLHLIDGLGMDSQFAKSSWCQKERWDHLPYVTHIGTL